MYFGTILLIFVLVDRGGVVIFRFCLFRLSNLSLLLIVDLEVFKL